MGTPATEGSAATRWRPTTPAKGDHFRSDIQGLRALAVTLVIAYHLWPNAVTGGFVGVDVFFVISGFLITSHLLSRPPLTGRDLVAFWGRRIRRLLPASLLVLAVTLVGTRLLAPVTEWASTAKEIVASALYVQNWHLAGASVDYLQVEGSPSPVQHFWSLSVEEQFYLLWPVLLLLAWRLGPGRSTRRRAQLVMVGVVGVSLALSILLTASEPASAYFITSTRMWEFAVGGIVATLVPLAQRRGLLGERLGPVLAWSGLAAVVLAAFLFTGATPFPGTAALLPVLGTAMVIWAASRGRSSPAPALAHRPVQWLGGVSYAAYLWHWPLIVLAPFVLARELTVLDKIAILAATLVLAGLTKTLVEDKFRTPRRLPSSTLRPFRFAAAGMALLVVLGSAQMAASSNHKQEAFQALEQVSYTAQDCFGAAALADPEGCIPTEEVQDPELIPDMAVAAEDLNDAYKHDCWENAPYPGFTSCTYGSGEIEVALVGNSHAGQWLPALQELADNHGWTVTTYLSSTCTVSSTELAFDAEKKSQGCQEWAQKALDATAGEKFDLVVTSEFNELPAKGADSRANSYEQWRAGYDDYLATWEDAGTNLLVIRDSPHPGATMPSVPDCLAVHEDDLGACSAPRSVWEEKDPLVEAAVALDSPLVSVADLNDYLCREERCYGVNGGVVTYFDGSHLTASYVKTLTPYLEQPLLEAISRAR